MTKKKENEVKRGIKLAGNSGRTRLYANPSGKAFYGRAIVSYGCGAEGDQKAPDFIGFHSIEITPEMVGKTVAVILWPEVKREGGKGKEKEREAAQQRGCDRVTAAGGIAGIVDSVEEFLDLISDYERELKS